MTVQPYAVEGGAGQRPASPTRTLPPPRGRREPGLIGTPEDPFPRDRRNAPLPGGRSTAPVSPRDMNALAAIREIFDAYFGGALTELVEQAWQWAKEGLHEALIVGRIRDSEPYARRFTGMKALRDAGRPISEVAYLDIEQRMAQTMRAYGLPSGFYDEPADFGRLIGSEVGPAELERRLSSWQRYEQETRDPVFEAEVRRQFAAAGMAVSEGYFLAAAMDPGRAVTAIERNLAAAGAGTEARRAGYGALSVDEALRVGDLGLERGQMAQGFDYLAERTELFEPLAGESDDDRFGRTEQLGAAFGTDAASRRRLERRGRQRMAEFAGGGSTAVGRRGLSALGSAG